MVKVTSTRVELGLTLCNHRKKKKKGCRPLFTFFVGTALAVRALVKYRGTRADCCLSKHHDFGAVEVQRSNTTSMHR